MTVIPSTPGLPLLAFTRRNAAFRFSRSHTSSINRFVLAGFSVPFLAPFSPFPSRLSGFTRRHRRKVQLHLDVLLLVVLEIHGLLAAPSRSGLQPSFPAWPIRCSAFRHAECRTSLADVMTYYALC